MQHGSDNQTYSMPISNSTPSTASSLGFQLFLQQCFIMRNKALSRPQHSALFAVCWVSAECRIISLSRLALTFRHRKIKITTFKISASHNKWFLRKIGSTVMGKYQYAISCIYMKDFISLRIADIHGAKTTKNRPFWYVLLHYLTTRPSINNLNIVFLLSGHRLEVCVLWWESWNWKCHRLHSF